MMLLFNDALICSYLFYLRFVTERENQTGSKCYYYTTLIQVITFKKTYIEVPSTGKIIGAVFDYEDKLQLDASFDFLSKIV